MTQKQNILWALLTKAEIVEGDRPRSQNINSPWYIKSLLAISGWLGALFLLGFIILAFNSFLEEQAACFVISILLFASAYAVLRTPKNEFFEHLALALSLAGQALFCWALSINSFDINSWLTIALVQVILVYFMPSFLHRLFSTLFAITAFEMALISSGQPYILGSIIIFPTTWLCLHEFNFVNHFKRLNGITYGFFIATIALNSQQFLSLDLYYLVTTNNQELLSTPLWLGQGLFVLAALFTAQQLLQQYQVNLFTRLSITVLIVTCILAIISLNAPGIMIGLMVILLGFSQSNKVLLGTGVISLLTYCSSYYYFMAETLLFKAGVLFTFAAVTLLLRMVLIKTAHLLTVKDK